MTEEEIAEFFIQAADVDRRLPDTARPARLKAMALPYLHDDEDIQGWGGERFEEERKAFWSKRLHRPTTEDVGLWERANALIVHVGRERDRRCLWAWAKSKATSLSFSKWCREVEHIHRNYGMQCKGRAIEQIYENMLRTDVVDRKIDLNCTLQFGPEISDIDVNIGHVLQKQKPALHQDMRHNVEEPRDNGPRTFAWMAPDAFASTVNAEARDFSWAEKQNARRRARAKKKAEQA